MNSDKILQSSFLDLLFENRNKAYGAYELRKNYGFRLKKAIFSTLTVMLLLFLLLSSFKKENTTKRNIGKVLDDITRATPEKEKPKEKDKPKPEVQKPKGNPAATVRPNVYTEPIVTTNVKLPIVDVTAPSNPLGTATSGTNIGGPVGTPTGTGTVPVKDSSIVNTTTPSPIVTPEPELPTTEAFFKGGKEAFGAYLQDKLGDEAIEDGETKRIVVSFTIEADGSISNVTATENDDISFVNKTIKAFLKMKKWQPALVKGKAIVTHKVIPVVITPEAY